MDNPLPFENRKLKMAQRVLVVDDEPTLLRLVKDRLYRAGYEVLTASSGEEALEVIRRRGLPHLAIVDLVMPGMGGFGFCQAVHEFSDLPIIMLSVVAEEETVVRGIQYFVEDYVIKPFSPGELVARVERVMRRTGKVPFAFKPTIEVDDRLRVDFSHKRAIVDGRSVDLTPTETKILYVLMCNAGRVTTTDFLLQRLWPLERAFEETLRVHVHRLRKKIEIDPPQPRYIITERGLGYRFRGND